MLDTPFQKPLQRLLGGMGDIPGLGVAGDCRARKIVLPPALDQLIDGGRPRFRGRGAVLDILGRSDASPGNFDGHRDTPTSRIYWSKREVPFRGFLLCRLMSPGSEVRCRGSPPG